MSTTYYNGGEQPHFSNLDGTVQGAQYAAKPSSRVNLSSCGRAFGKVLAATYFVLLTAVAVIAFILGCYATNRVRSTPDAVLVSDPKAVPGPGYSVFSLGTGLGYWSPAADMIYARSDHGVISYEKYAYLVGGMGLNVTTKNGTVIKNGTVLNKVVRYDTETGMMYELKDLPEARYRFAYAQLNGRIYVMGGTADAVNGTPSNSVFVYDVAANKWAPIGKLKTARVDPCGAAANGKVYVFGGYDTDGRSLATVEVCDPATALGSAEQVCTQLPASSNMLQDRGDCRAVAIGGLIYAVGGVQWYNNSKGCEDEKWVNCYRFLNSVEVFNPTSGSWRFRSPMISPRGDFGIEALPGDRIIVAGGERGNGTQNAMAIYDVEEYIVQDDIWVQKAPLPEARFRADLAHVSGRVYAFGGTPSCGLVDDAPCNTVALKTVFAYFDVQYPRLYAFFKADSTRS